MSNASKNHSTMTAIDSLPKTMSRRTVVISRIKRRILKHIWLARLGLLSLVFLAIAGVILIAGKIIAGSPFGQFVSPAKNFLLSSTEGVESTDGRTNILLLGRGGEGHEAPELTDTIMLGSVSHQNNKGVLISLPRDLWVDSLQAKLNSAYYWGNKKQDKGGLLLAKATVEEIVGTPVHYAVVIDFSGFKRIIDELGDIEVDVPASFVDKKFPIPGRERDECDGDITYACRYETIEFTQGKQLMNGETALKFVRSRHAEGDEGTDFARSRRQQAVINGIKDKLLTSGILFNPDKINGLIKVGESVIETDIPKEASGGLARIAFEARDNVSTQVLSEDLLINPPISAHYQNQYVFVPKEGNWSEVQNWVKTMLP